MGGEHEAGENKADIGLIGLGVMGQNLVLNLADHGYRVAVYNRTSARTRAFVTGPAAGTTIIGYEQLDAFVAGLEAPRRIMIMVQAGAAVDDVIEQLVPLLAAGDVIIDGGNSLYTDTIRRSRLIEAKQLRYIGVGVSGGEEGARHGPSMMPGGTPEAWPVVRDLFQSIAAKVDGEPCCDWVGPDGAGHYVKMVHNGIEYGDMQVIAEAYQLMSVGLGMTAAEMHETFAAWNRGKLDSYLIEITADILAAVDDDGTPIVDLILDTAGQKGTGKWTVISSMELGMPTTLVAEAVYGRIISALKAERTAASRILSGPAPVLAGHRAEVLGDIHDALYASKIISYAQGFMLFGAAAAEYDWDLDFGSIASMWRDGAIIRSAFLGEIRAAYARDPALANLLVDPYFRHEVSAAQAGWRRTVARAVTAGIPVPAYASALGFFDSFRTERLPANLIQAQRDYFGAHTYERVDRPRGEFFHTDWTGAGGDATAGAYNV